MKPDAVRNDHLSHQSSLHPFQIQVLEIETEIRQRGDRLHFKPGRFPVPVAGEYQKRVCIVSARPIPCLSIDHKGINASQPKGER